MGLAFRVAFGIVAFFSVFIFMFKGRTATFTGLVNRLTSLVAGTTATLLGWAFFHSKFPTLQNWVQSPGFALVAVAFLTRAERKPAVELKAARKSDPLLDIRTNYPPDFPLSRVSAVGCFLHD